MTRTPQDVFAAHGAALAGGDVDKILEDYSDDALLLTVDGPVQGHDAIRDWLTTTLGSVPEAEFTVESAVFAGDALLLRWSAASPKGRLTDGVDTLVFAEGKIRLQSVLFRREPV